MQSIRPVTVLDQTINVNQPRALAVVKAASDSNFFKDVSSSSSLNSITHSITPPHGVVLDRRMFIRWFVQLNFTGPAGVGNLLQLGSNDGVRAYPASACTNTSSVTINGQRSTFYNAPLIHALARYIGQKDKEYQTDSFPMLDYYQSYSDYTTYGSARNPLAFSGENSYEATRSDGKIIVVSNTATAAVVRIEVTEPVFVQPLTTGHRAQPGLVGCQNLIFQFQLGDLSRMWSHASAGNAISTIVPSFYQPPELLYKAYTPGPDAPIISRDYFYSYFNIQYTNSPATAVTAGASGQLVSNVITLTSIPSRVYVFVRQQDQDRTYLTTDTFARIDQLSVQWDNRSNLLSTATSNDLYRMSKQNGLQDNWTQFCRYSGSVVCLDTARNIGLNGNQAVGMIGNFQLQVTANFTNLSSGTINYSLYVVTIQPGIFSLSQDSASVSTALLTQQDVLVARQSNASLEQVDENEPFGGGFWGDLWQGIKDVGRSILPAAKAILPVAAPFLGSAGQYVQPALGVAEKILGNGVGGVENAKRLKRKGVKGVKGGAASIGGAMIGGSVIGGAMNQNKKMLLHKLMSEE